MRREDSVVGRRAAVVHWDRFGLAWKGPEGRVLGFRRFKSEKFPAGVKGVMLHVGGQTVLPCYWGELRLLEERGSLL